MKETKLSPQENLDDESRTSLEYKEHRDFFAKLFELRNLYNLSMGEFMTSLTQDNLLNSTSVLIGLVDWTNSQLSKKLNVTILKKRIIALRTRKDFQHCYFELDSIFQEISNAHEACELIPKINIMDEDETVKFWKEEGTASMREMKKAFYDLYMLNNE